MRFLTAVLLCAFLLLGVLSAQTGNGTVTGVVTDATGAVVANAPIELKNTETGVVYSRTNDPVNGRRSGWGTYEGVGVTNDPRAAAPPPPPRQGPDPQIVEQRVREKSLPQGRTRNAVAGYLFFPQYTKHKGSGMELQWSKDDASVALRLPEK